MCVLLWGVCGDAAPSLIDVDAAARSAGNARADATRIARALLARDWAAQITQVRVDRVAEHRVAGITLLGVKLRHRVDSAEFLREANEVVDLALSTDGGLEEVDLRATVPAPRRGSVGEMDQPFIATVFTLTVRRDAIRGRSAYWDPAWRAGLNPPRARVVR